MSARAHLAAAAALTVAASCSLHPDTEPVVTPAPVTAGQLDDRDFIRLWHAQSTPTAKPRGKPKHKRSAKRTRTAVVIRRVTAYCYTGSTTYTGVWPKRGMAAVKQSTGIPFGARLLVSGWGWFTVTDREPPYGSSDVDLYMGWRQGCTEWADRWFGTRRLPMRVVVA